MSMSKMDRKRRNFVKGIGAVAATVGIAGCSSQSDSGSSSDSEGSSGSGPNVLMGYGGSLTGKWDFNEDSMGPLLNMTIEHINEQGGPLGGTLEMSRRDTAVQVDQARQVMQQHINQDDANFLMGYNSSTLVPLWDFIQGQDMPLITPWMGSTYKDTRGGDNGTPDDMSDDEWVWRSIPGDGVSTAAAAIGMRDRGVENFGVLNGTSAGERAWSDALIASTKPVDQLNMQRRIEVEEGKSSYQSELSRLFQGDLDLWVIAIGIQDAQVVLREWDQGGYGVPVMLENILQQETLLENLRSSIGTPDAELLLYSQLPNGPQKEKVREMYESYTDQTMIPWNYAAWDGIHAAMLAIERAGAADPDSIQQNIGPVTRPTEDSVEVTSFEEGKEELQAGNEINYQGATSSFNFTDKGNIATPGTTFDVSVEDATFTQDEMISESEINDIITDPAFIDYLSNN